MRRLATRFFEYLQCLFILALLLLVTLLWIDPGLTHTNEYIWRLTGTPRAAQLAGLWQSCLTTIKSMWSISLEQTGRTLVTMFKLVKTMF